MFGSGPSSAQSRVATTMQGALEMARAQQAKKRSLIGGGEGLGGGHGIAEVTADNQVGSLAQSSIPGGTLGAGGFAQAPAIPGGSLGPGGFPVATANPEMAAESSPVASETMATAAAARDPYNNAIRTPQQDAVGQIQGNAFMRDRSLYI